MRQRISYPELPRWAPSNYQSSQKAFLGLFRERDVMMEKRSGATLLALKMEEETKNMGGI